MKAGRNAGFFKIPFSADVFIFLEMEHELKKRIVNARKIICSFFIATKIGFIISLVENTNSVSLNTNFRHKLGSVSQYAMRRETTNPNTELRTPAT